MKTNLSMDDVKACILGTAKKFKTVEAKILLDKGSYRNVALMVEAGQKGSKLSSESSEKLTKNVCDHVILEFINQITKHKGWVQMHDGKVFGITPGVQNGKDAPKHEASEIFNNEKLCFCNREKPESKTEKKEVKPEKTAKKDEITMGKAGKPGKSLTLDKVLKDENKKQNSKDKKALKAKKESKAPKQEAKKEVVESPISPEEATKRLDESKKQNEEPLTIGKAIEALTAKAE